MKLHALIKATLVASLLVAIAVPHADAQRRGDRQAQQQRESMFPEATREEPRHRTPQRMGQRMERLYDLSGEDNPQRVIEEANALINDRNADANVRSFSYIQIAEAYEDLDDSARAIEYYQRAIDEDGLGNDNHYQVMLRLGQSLVFEERVDEGIAVLERFFEETRSRNPQHLALMGSSLYQAERWDGAIQYMTMAIEASETPQPSWQQILMASYAEADRMDEAAEVARRSVELQPDDKRAVMNLASVLSQADRIEEAAEVLDGARQRGLFDEGRDYDQLARLFLNIDGGEAQAAAVLREGMDQGLLEGNYDNWFMLGQAEYFSENYDGAITAWTEAASRAPDGEVALNLARVHLDEGNYSDAVRYANEAIQKGVRNPDTARAIINNANIELRR